MTGWLMGALLLVGILTVACLLWASSRIIAASVTLDRTVLLLHALTADVATGNATGDRIEAAAVVVAADLSDTHARADAAEGPHGAASDAAMRSGDA